MKITESTCTSFRKEIWSECYFELQDIGHRTCWGHIIEIKTGHIIEITSVFPLTDKDWIEFDDAQRLISRLKVKSEN